MNAKKRSKHRASGMRRKATTSTQQGSYKKVATKKCIQQGRCNKNTTKCIQQNEHSNSRKRSIGKNDGKAKGRSIGWNRIAKRPTKDLLKDSDVRRWYENRYRSSVNNSGVMLRRLNLFCDRIGMTPKEYAELGKKDIRKTEDVLLDHVKWLEDHKYTSSYMEGIIKTAKSWMEFHRVDIKVRIRFRNSKTSTTLENEVNPTPDHIKQMLASAPPRARVIISMMAFSGIRPQVMGMSDGSDGLKLGDFPELVIDGKAVSFAKVPTVVVIRASLSKISSKYTTFLSKTGCECVLGYLRERIAQGEMLGPESPLIRVTHGWEKKGWNPHKKVNRPFMSTTAVTGKVSKIIKSVIKIRTYSLRSYFDSQLLIAESNACMTHAYRQFFMGHKGDMEARYTTNKGRLTEQMLEDMRRAYRNSQYFLYPDDAEGKTDKKDMLLNLWRQQAASYGIDVSNLLRADSEDDSSIPSDGKSKSGSEKPAEAGTEQVNSPEGQDGRPKSKVVSGDDELVKYLDMGWSLTRELANGRYIVQNDTEVGKA